MKKLKILFITQKLENYIGQVTYDFQMALSKITDLTVWNNPGDLREILSKLTVVPDFILLYNFSNLCCPKITGIAAVNIPVGLLAEDCHFDVEEYRKFITQNNIRYVFPKYYNALCNRLPELTDRMFWLPHSVNLEIYKDYGLPKDINYLIMGSAHSVYYPLRHKIIETMYNEPGFIFHPHPGYGNYNPDDPSIFVKERYAKEINRAKIFFTDGSIYDYAVQKYFEIPACKTLLMANNFNELRALGFIPGVNFVDIDENTILEKARYYLNHDKEREKITQNGYELVISRHSVDIRAAQFIEYVEAIIDCTIQKKLNF